MITSSTWPVARELELVVKITPILCNTRLPLQFRHRHEVRGTRAVVVVLVPARASMAASKTGGTD